MGLDFDGVHLPATGVLYLFIVWLSHDQITESDRDVSISEDIDSLLNLKEKLSYFIYNTRIHLVNPDNVIDEIGKLINI